MVPPAYAPITPTGFGLIPHSFACLRIMRIACSSSERFFFQAEYGIRYFRTAYVIPCVLNQDAMSWPS